MTLLLVVAAVAYLFTASGFLGSPLRFDEVEWAVQVEGILDHGVPRVDYADNPGIWLHSPFGYDAVYGMWHPPLYLYSLAAGAALFGPADAVLRATGLVWFAGSLALLAVLAGGLAEPRHRGLARRLALALALLAPLSAEGSLYLDIDNTSLAFGTLLFLVLYLRHLARPSPTRLALVVVAFAFCLASKLTTPLILVASVGLYHLLDRDLRGLVRAAAIALAGGALFALGYLAYCRIFDYPAAFMFDVSYLGKTEMYTEAHGLKLGLASLRWHLVWVSLPVAAVIAAAVARRAAAFRRRRRLAPVDLPLVFALAALVAYVPWGGMVGKYMVPALLAAAAAASVTLAPRLAEWPGAARPRAVAGWTAAFAAAHLLALPVLRFKPPGSSARTATWAGALGDPRNFQLLAAALLLALFALAVRRALSSPLRQALPVMLVLWAAVAPPLEAAKLQALPWELSPYRPLAERGFRDTLALVDRQLGPGTVIVAPKDAGYYFSGRHYGTEAVLIYEGRETLHALMRSPEVCAVVDSVAYPSLSAEDLRLGLPATAAELQVGTFAVFLTCGAFGAPAAGSR